VTDAKIAAIRARLDAILESIRFPADRWQLIAAADYLGSDLVTRRAMHDLSSATYPDWTAVVEELARTWLVGHPIDSATGDVLAPD
jgi:hypothetical protein